MERGKWLIPSNSLPVQLSRHQNERSAIAVLSGGHKLVLSNQAPCDIFSRAGPKKGGQITEATQSLDELLNLGCQNLAGEVKFWAKLGVGGAGITVAAAKVDRQGFVRSSRRHRPSVRNAPPEHCCEISTTCKSIVVRYQLRAKVKTSPHSQTLLVMTSCNF